MKNNVTLCHKNNCIQATGSHAEVISTAVAVMLFLFGLSGLIRALNN